MHNRTIVNIYRNSQKQLIQRISSELTFYKGPSINYVGKILPIFDPPSPSVGKFTTQAYVVNLPTEGEGGSKIGIILPT